MEDGKVAVLRKGQRARSSEEDDDLDEIDLLDESERRQLALELAQQNVIRAHKLMRKTSRGMSRFLDRLRDNAGDEDVKAAGLAMAANMQAMTSVNESLLTLSKSHILGFGAPSSAPMAARIDRVTHTIKVRATPSSAIPAPPMPQAPDASNEPPLPANVDPDLYAVPDQDEDDDEFLTEAS